MTTKIQVGTQSYGGGVAGGPEAPLPQEPVVTRRSDGSVRVRVGDAVHTAFVEGDQVWVDGRVRRVRPVAAAGVAALPDKVTPPMPATVVKVLVAVGETVEKGQKLVTVAAMKMETALRSPRAGVVTKVNAEPGRQVRPTDELVVVE